MLAFALRNAVQHRVGGGYVVKAGRGQYVLVKAAEQGLFVVVEQHVIAQDVFGFDAHVLREHLEEEAVLIEFAFDGLCDGQHVLVRVHRNALVDLAVQVDSKVRNREDRFSKIHQPALGFEHVFALHGDHTRAGKRTVEPGRVDHAAVGLHGEL